MAAVALPAAPVCAGGDWVRVRSDRLEVLSDVGPVAAVEAAARLGRLRVVLGELFPGRDPERPLTLVMLGDRERFSSFVPRRHRRPDQVGGFFRGGDERDYAVFHFTADGPRPFGAPEHEYAHLALNASLPAQPVWVAEGLAELLSDAVFQGREARLGAARPEYESLLRNETPMPMAELLAIGHDSPEYLGEARSEVLYAQSWALVRWVVHRFGLAGLRGFLVAVSEGSEPVAAFGERLAALDEARAEMLDVPPGPVLRVAGLDLPGEPARFEAPPRADVEQRLGDLLLHAGHLKRARHHLERALDADRDHVPARTSLARFWLRQGKSAEARRELERAIELAPDDPVVLLRHARLRLREALSRGEPLPEGEQDRLVADLERALSRAPRLHEAALLLAELRPEPYPQRIALLEPLFEQQPERIEVAQALARLHVRSRNLSAARRVLARAREAAVEPAYRFLLDHLMSRIGGFEAATVEVRGRLLDLACLGDGSLVLAVDTGARVLRLEAASTHSFFVQGESVASGQRELTCGAQDLPLVVRYQPGGTYDPRAAGRVVWLSVGEPPG